MLGESLFYFTTTKLITIKNKRVGFLNHCIQAVILSYILWDLIYHELYKKVEIPSGYTTFWTENGNLTDIQKTTNFSTTMYCDNSTYNYAYDNESWVYSNFSCVNLPYAEMYEKGENEFFFLTHFTEYDTTISNCPGKHIKCQKQTSHDFFTVGSEGMLLAFDHLYTTTFDKGSNVGNTGLKLIDTYIKDVDGNIVRHFNKGETVKLYVEDWLKYADISLDDYNVGTPVSLNHPLVPEPNLPFHRMSGVEIIIQVNYHNIKYFSGYSNPTCEINIQPNSGWASKGSFIHYIDYPNVSDIHNTYHYIDRYRYGIKFKFIVSGLMGEFNMNSLITHLVSGIVLVNMSTLIVSCFIMYLTGDYGKYFSKLRYTKTSINVPCFKKCTGEKKNQTESQISRSNIRRRARRNGLTGTPDSETGNNIEDITENEENRYHGDIYLDSESSYNYSDGNMSDPPSHIIDSRKTQPKEENFLQNGKIIKCVTI